MLSPISVALCADKNVEVGLHVTLYSLLESSQNPIKINLIQKGYKAKDINKINQTLQPFQNQYELNVIEFDEQIFRGYKGLHGNKFPYVKIMLPSLVSDEKLIYLDSDLVIKKELSSLYLQDLEGYVLGAFPETVIKNSLEKDTFFHIGLDEDAKHLNSGVMLIDVKKWNELEVTNQCLDVFEKYGNTFRGLDPILNCVFYKNNFYQLDKSYNYALYPNSPPLSEYFNSIFHFVGSPKPWDLLGENLNKNYKLFEEILRKTAFSKYKSYLNISPKKVRRTIKLSRSYYNCIRKSHKSI